MRRLITVLKTSLVGSLIVLLALFSPALAYAADGSDANTCVPPTSTTPGVHHPIGADAAAYTYNCDTGLWVSDHFTFDPATNVTTPKDPVVYTYNDKTGLWDTITWTYNAPQQKYLSSTTSVSEPPAGAQKVGGPKTVTSMPTTPINPMSGSSATITDGTNTSTSSTGNSLAVANIINGVAVSGGAIVNQNTTAGSAQTGDATSMATIMNLLQSNTNAFGNGSNAVSFVSNINGDVNGDLILDAAQLSSLQPASNSPVNNQNIVVNNDSNNSINNTINLTAQSGSAGVTKNTTAGDATTGNATAVANIVNIINSAITSGKSFLGVININGNLNGDILLPPNFIDQLVASNVPTTTINTSQLAHTNSSVSQVNNSNITNNLGASAASGNASVAGNTTAGSATTGTASTNITAFNLTGSQILGKNSILVFVNVTGKWVGMIVNAPPGATAAQLAGGVSADNQIPDSDVSSLTNNSISNDVSVNAASGDANVSKNTTAGDATSGDAKASINVLNIANSNMSFSDWLGVLFINVFGSWNGSFGVNTSAGDPPATSGQSTGGVSSPIMAFRFAPSSPKVTIKKAAKRTTSTITPDQTSVLGTSSNNDATLPAAAATNINPQNGSSFAQVFIWSGVVGVALISLERLASFRRRSAL